MNDDIKDYFSVGSCVTAHPMPNDLFDHSFDGVVTGYHGEFIIVKDQDDDCFDCEASQLDFQPLEQFEVDQTQQYLNSDTLYYLLQQWLHILKILALA